MANQIKGKYIENGAVDGLKLLLKSDQTLRRLLEDGSTQDVIAYLEGLISQVGDDLQDAISQLQAEIAQEASDRASGDTNLQNQITSIQGAGDTLFEDDASVYADATAGIEDPNGRDGWYYKSAGSSDKVNWYFFDGQQTQVTVGQLESLYTVATVDSSSNDTFHLAYYTIPLGDGNDAGSWYRSRQVFVPVEPFQRGEKALFWVKNQPDASVYPNLPRVQMQPTSVVGSSVGLNADSELLLTTAFGTNSAAEANTVELVANKLGIESSVYNKEYTLEIRGEFTLSGIKESLLEEAISREQADANLQDQINDILSNVDPAAIDSFTEVVTAFQNADSNLNNAITSLANSASSDLSNEESARISADNTLQSNIDTVDNRVANEESVRASEITRVEGLISDESASRESSFDALEGQLELIEGEVAPFVYADEAIPAPSKLLGWKYKKANENVGVVGGRKINWYFFNDNADHDPLLPPSDLGFEKGITIADLNAGQFSFSGIFEEMGNGQFLLQVYTKPRAGDTGWYHSRQTYSINPKELGIEGMRKLFYIVNSPSSNPEELDTLEIPLTSTAYHSGTQVQDVLDSDELKLIAIATNSAAPIGTEMYVDRVIVSMGAHSYNRRLTHESEAKVQGLLEGFSHTLSHVDVLQAKVATLESQVATLEGAAFEKENFVLSATDITNGYIDLSNEANAKSVRFYVGRLAGFEGEDYELSVVSGVTRITFIGSFASGGSEAMAENDKVKVSYSY